MPAPPELARVTAFLEQAFRLPESIEEAPALAARCTEHVTGNSRLTPAAQVELYRRQYWSRHLESLTEDYPGALHLLGEEAFEAFCRAYLEAHPPHAPSLRDLGADIVAFAAGYTGFPEGYAASAREMFRYENAFIDIFDGEEPPPLDPQKLASLPPEAWATARIGLHPLLVPLRLEHPVHWIRARARAEEPRAEGPPLPAPASVVIYRRDKMIHFEELEPSALSLLEALSRGEPLGRACDEVARDLDAAAAEALGEQVGPWFRRWTELGFIVDIAA